MFSFSYDYSRQTGRASVADNKITRYYVFFVIIWTELFRRHGTDFTAKKGDLVVFAHA